MLDKANDPLPIAPDLSETADAIARGRELEEVQTTIEQSDRVLDRSQQLLGDRKGE
jgi:hypothetical protein